MATTLKKLFEDTDTAGPSTERVTGWSSFEEEVIHDKDELYWARTPSIDWEGGATKYQVYSGGEPGAEIAVGGVYYPKWREVTRAKNMMNGVRVVAVLTASNYKPKETREIDYEKYKFNEQKWQEGGQVPTVFLESLDESEGGKTSKSSTLWYVFPSSYESRPPRNIPAEVFEEREPAPPPSGSERRGKDQGVDDLLKQTLDDMVGFDEQGRSRVRRIVNGLGQLSADDLECFIRTFNARYA